MHNLGGASGVVRLDFRGGFVIAGVGILGGEVVCISVATGGHAVEKVKVPV